MYRRYPLIKLLKLPLLPGSLGKFDCGLLVVFCCVFIVVGFFSLLLCLQIPHLFHCWCSVTSSSTFMSKRYTDTKRIVPNSALIHKGCRLKESVSLFTKLVDSVPPPALSILPSQWFHFSFDQILFLFKPDQFLGSGG